MSDFLMELEQRRNDNYYRKAYGELATDTPYNVGESIAFAGGNMQGEILWVYRNARGLVYVVDDLTGLPAEVYDKEVTGRG